MRGLVLMVPFVLLFFCRFFCCVFVIFMFFFFFCKYWGRFFGVLKEKKFCLQSAELDTKNKTKTKKI